MSLIDGQNNVSIEDYAANVASKSKNSYEFKEYLRESFEICFRAKEACFKETKDLWELYENKLENADDIYKQGVTPEEQRMIVRSLCFPMLIDTRISIVLQERLRVYLDPIFKEDFKELFVSALEEKILPLWVVEDLEANGGDIESFIDKLLDSLLDDWWDAAAMDSKSEIGMRSAYLSSESYFQFRRMRRSDTTRDIVLEVLPPYNAAGDPKANTVADQKFFFTWRDCHIRDVEDEYGLKDGEIVPDSGELNVGESSYTIGKENDAAAKIPTVVVVQGYFRDNQKDPEGNFVYPNGRLVDFILQNKKDQNTGVTVLSDRPYGYSTWPVAFRPKQLSETRGKPVARDLEPTDKVMTQVVQQALANQRLMNGMLFTQPNAITDQSKLKNIIGGIVEHNDMQYKYEAPQNAAAPGLNLATWLRNSLMDAAQVHEVALGRRPGDIESGGAIFSLQQSVHQNVATDQKHLAETYRQLFRWWGEMMLEVTGKGHRIRRGPGYRHSVKLPFSFYAFIEDVDVRVGPDTRMREDPQGIVNVLSQINPDNPFVEIIADYLPAEVAERAKKSLKARTERADMAQQNAQQNEMMQQTVAKMQSENEGLKNQVQNMTLEKKAKIIQGQQAAQQADAERAKSLMVEDSWQKNQIQKEGIKGLVQVAVAKLRAAKNKIVGAKKTGESKSNGIAGPKV